MARLRGKVPGNPVDIPGVVVYRPDYDPTYEYVPTKNAVVDRETGEKFFVRSPHGEGAGSFQIVSAARKQVVMGSFYVHFIDIEKFPSTRVYDIAHIFDELPVPIDTSEKKYDVSRIARFFVSFAYHGQYDRFAKSSKVVVVDSRPLRAA
jgi:hypothetical protein